MVAANGRDPGGTRAGLPTGAPQGGGGGGGGGGAYYYLVRICYGVRALPCPGQPARRARAAPTGTPMISRQLSCCCFTSGFVGATNRTLPWGRAAPARA
jgi:hypothetical protein